MQLHLYPGMSDISDQTMAVWVQLFRTQRAARLAVDAALTQARLPSLETYDVLLELERAGKDGLRAYALENALLLPQYGVSRLLERLRRRALVSRHPCPEDGRGVRFRITTAGRKMRTKMWGVYGPVIKTQLSGRISPAEANTLVTTLQKISGVTRHDNHNKSTP